MQPAWIFVGVWAFLMALPFIMYFRYLIGSKMRLSAGRLCFEQDIPIPLREQLSQNIANLIPLGFESSHYEEREETNASIDKKRWIAIMWHPIERCYAVISNSLLPDSTVPVNIEFITLYAEDHLSTTDGMAHGVVPGFSQAKIFDVFAKNIVQRFQGHLHKRIELGEKYALDKACELSAEQFCERLDQISRDFVEFLLKRGIIRSAGESWRFNTVPAVKLVQQMKTGDAKLLKIRSRQLKANPPRPEYLTGPEVDAYFRHQQMKAGASLGAWGKLLAFAASAVFFAVLFGVALSPRMVLILVPVLLFHELGHLAAMRLFGYRDLQVLFMPLGALAIGSKKDPTAMQKAIVSLAGPVPGLLVAFALATLLPDWQQTEWVFEFVIMLFVLNYLNLLPFMPLDGGQLVNTLLFDRYPRLRIGFQLFSICAFLLFAWLLSDPIIAVLGVFLAFGLPTLFCDTSLLRGLVKQGVSGKEEAEIVPDIFVAMKDKAWLFQQKLQTAIRLVPSLIHPPTRLREAFAGLFLYVIILMAPLLVAADRFGLFGLYGNGYSETTDAGWTPEDLSGESWSVTHWQKRMANEADPRARFDLAVEAVSTVEDESMEATLVLAEQGIELAQTNGWTSETEYAELLLKAVEFSSYLEGKEAEADTYLTELKHTVSEEDARYAVGLFLVGQARSNIEDMERAFDIQLAVGDIDGQSDSLAGLAWGYESAGRLDEAEQSLRKTSTLAEENWEKSWAADRLAEFLIRSSRMDEAITLLEQSAVEFSDEDEWFNSDDQTLIWAALFADRLGLAEHTIRQQEAAQVKQREEIRDSLGFLTRILMGDALDVLVNPSAFDFEARLVLAHLMGDITAMQQQLTNMKKAVEKTSEFNWSRYISVRQRSSKKIEEQRPGLHARKAVAVLAALESLGAVTVQVEE